MKKRLITVVLTVAMILTFAPLIGGVNEVYAIGYYGANLDSANYRAPANGFPWGQCTWYAFGRALEKTGTRLPVNGNAKDWLSASSSTTPRANSVAVWTDGQFGHVAFVEAVENGLMYITESNRGNAGTYSEGIIRLSDGYYTPSYEGKTGAYYCGLPEGYIYCGTSSDKTGPSYDDFHVAEISSTQFTVMAHVTDPSGIKSVRYAVWSDKNGQDDLKWYDGHHTDGNGYYWCHVPFSEHNNEKGNYIIHMYAEDNAGNLTNPGTSYNFSTKGPSYDDFHVGEFRDGAFSVMAHVTDPNGVKYVRYAVWTEKNGQDELKWYDGNHTDGNGYYWIHVNLSEHKNELGKYIIHMYAADKAGKEISAALTYTFPEKGPTISNVTVSDVSSTGYTVSCTVKDPTGVKKVSFPTWTTKNGQDDIVSDWPNNTSIVGTKNGDVYTFRVKSSAHNNETGEYFTDIYAWNKLGTTTPDITNDSPRRVKVNVHDHSWTIDTIEPTCIEDGYRSYKCKLCNEIRTEKYPTSGHKWAAEYTVDRAATSTSDGMESIHCLVCGAVKPGSERTIPAYQTNVSGNAINQGTSAEAVHAAITGMPNDNDLPGSVFGKLQLRSKKQTKTSVTLSWKKIPGATSYVIYGNKCGSNNKMERLATSVGKSMKFTNVLGRKVKKGTYYKFMIIALDNNNKVVSASKIVHVATKGGKVGNVGKVTTRAKKNKVSVKAGKTFKLSGKQKPAVKKLKVKKHRPVTYESSNPQIATVSKKGVIKGNARGTCYVYAYAQNGVFAKVKVTVK